MKSTLNSFNPIDWSIIACFLQRTLEKGFTNMSRPFILLRNSTWKCIPKRGQYGPTVYIANLVKQLQAWEVSQYITTAEGALTINLPIPTPLQSEDTTIEESDEDLDGTQWSLETTFGSRATLAVVVSWRDNNCMLLFLPHGLHELPTVDVL